MFNTIKIVGWFKKVRIARNTIRRTAPNRRQAHSLLLLEIAKSTAQKRIYSTIRTGL